MGWAEIRESSPSGLLRWRICHLYPASMTSDSMEKGTTPPEHGLPGCVRCRPAQQQTRDFFFFFIFKKIKILKIYVHFEKFQNYPPIALWGTTGPRCNFFLQISNEVPGRKKIKGGPVAPPTADRGACRRPPRATGACSPI